MFQHQLCMLMLELGSIQRFLNQNTYIHVTHPLHHWCSPPTLSSQLLICWWVNVISMSIYLAVYKHRLLVLGFWILLLGLHTSYGGVVFSTTMPSTASVYVPMSSGDQVLQNEPMRNWIQYIIKAVSTGTSFFFFLSRPFFFYWCARFFSMSFNIIYSPVVCSVVVASI